jgi:hypothetical protein
VTTSTTGCDGQADAVVAWPDLPAAIKAGIVAMVESARP